MTLYWNYARLVETLRGHFLKCLIEVTVVRARKQGDTTLGVTGPMPSAYLAVYIFTNTLPVTIRPIIFLACKLPAITFASHWKTLMCKPRVICSYL